MMKMNRKALALLASVLLAVSAAGCGNPAEDSGPALEAVASLPESGKETGAEPDAGEPAATAEPTAATTTEPTAEPAAEPTVEPTAAPTTAPTAEPTVEPTAAPTAEPTTAPTAEPTTEPTAKPTAAPTAEPTVAPTVAPTAAPTAEPTTAPTATAEPEKTVEPAATAAPAQPAEGNAAPPVLASNAPATSGVVTSTETVTTQVEHQRPEGMPAVCYSQDEVMMAMLLYGQPGDGYTDNGDGTFTYCWCGPDGSSMETVTNTVTTDNWYSGTEADVLAKLDELRAAYPEGTYWGLDSVYDNPGSTIDAYISNSNACAGFAKLVSDYCFGYDAPCREVWITYDKLRPGDIIVGVNHASVYTGGYEQNGNGYVLNDVSGNHNSSVIWSAGAFTGPSYKGGMEELCVITRWPE